MIGNQDVARYRIRTGRRVGSAALVADGLHATPTALPRWPSCSAPGRRRRMQLADPVVGLLIAVAIVAVLREAAREVYRG